MSTEQVLKEQRRNEDDRDRKKRAATPAGHATALELSPPCPRAQLRQLRFARSSAAWLKHVVGPCIRHSGAGHAAVRLVQQQQCCVRCASSCSMRRRRAPRHGGGRCEHRAGPRRPGAAMRRQRAATRRSNGPRVLPRRAGVQLRRCAPPVRPVATRSVSALLTPPQTLPYPLQQARRHGRRRVPLPRAPPSRARVRLRAGGRGAHRRWMRLGQRTNSGQRRSASGCCARRRCRRRRRNRRTAGATRSSAVRRATRGLSALRLRHPKRCVSERPQSGGAGKHVRRSMRAQRSPRDRKNSPYSRQSPRLVATAEQAAAGPQWGHAWPSTDAGYPTRLLPPARALSGAQR